MSPLVKGAIVLLVGFLLVFPKGGLKVGGVPLTWGYLAMMLLFVASLAALRSAGAAAALSRSRLVVVGALLPFQLVAWSAFLAYGWEATGFAISFLVTFFFLPLVWVLGFAYWIDRVDLTWVLRLVRAGIFVVAVYGIFLFFYKLHTGSFVEIPFLTVNQGDLGELEGKYIDRGGVFKLISTYNNGNLYGVSLLQLLPLYCWMERSRVRTSVVKLSLVLTLSRTIWIGLLLHEILWRLFVRPVSLRTLATLVLSLIPVLAGAVWAVEALIGRDALPFLLDARLGGRIHQLRELELGFLPRQQFAPIAEMVYVSVLDQFGLLGLAGFLIALGTPLALFFCRAVPGWRTEYKRSLAAGLLLYLIVAGADGAILLIPVMAFFWFVVSILLSDNPTFVGADSRGAGEVLPAAAPLRERSVVSLAGERG